MARHARQAIWVVGLIVAAGWAAGRPVPPGTYELSINGEPFVVEANRRTTLVSRNSPGVKYDVALRIAPRQRLALRTLALAYDRGFAASVEEGEGLATATLAHELGFSVIVTDLGTALDGPQREKYMQGLVEAMRTTALATAVGPIEISAAAPTDAKSARGEVVVLRWKDRGDLSRACGIYVLNVGKTGCSVVATMLDEDAEDAQPMVEAILDSLEARPAKERTIRRAPGLG